jgi:hypothetical protein
MVSEISASSGADPAHSPAGPSLDETELRHEMRVIGDRHKALGTLDALQHDTETGALTGLTVRHGLYSQRLTSVPGGYLSGVSQGVIVLQISKAAFMQLPRIEQDLQGAQTPGRHDTRGI